MEIEPEWSDYGFDWLYGSDTASHMPIEEQVKQYKTRNLEKSRVYLMAAKLWGLGARSRRRIIIAPPMNEPPLQMKGSPQTKAVVLGPPVQGVHKIQEKALKKGKDWALSKREQDQVHDEGMEEKTVEYRHWLKDRVKLREGLDNLGLSENWLRKKEDLTPLEQRVCHQMEVEWQVKEAARLQRISDKSNFYWHKIGLSFKGGNRGNPKITRPVPEGLIIIVNYLFHHRQRVMDLFTRADKDKNWTLTRKEFKLCVKEACIPISNDLLTELIDWLDTDGDDLIQYRELVAGVKDFKLKERSKDIPESHQSTRRRQMAVNVDSPDDKPKNAITQQQKSSARLPSSESPQVTTGEAPRSSSTMSEKTATSKSTSTSAHLPLPKSDVTARLDMVPDDIVEKRKIQKHLTEHRTKSQRKKCLDKIKTGNTAIDNHSRRSTLRGEIGANVDRYREARLKEFYQICELCAKTGTVLTPELLQRALLHPGDKPHRRIRTHIRQPGIQTISSHFADPPEMLKSPSEKKIVISSRGEVLMDAKHVYPQRQEVGAEPEVMNLSSGKAFIRRKVDCWMTFQEYDRLTSHLGKRYVNVNKTGVDPNAFWPGQLLDKMRLCMPSGRISPTECIFSTTSQHRPVNVGYSNKNLTWWPVSDKCYVKPGDIEHQKKYTIDWK